MTPTAADWQQLLVNLAVSITVAVTATALFSRWVTPPAWRRLLWQACTLVLVGIFLFELVGLNHELTASWQRLITGSDNSDLAVSLPNRSRETDASLRSASATQCYDQNPDVDRQPDDFSSPTIGSTLEMEPPATRPTTEIVSPAQSLADEQTAVADSGSTDHQPAETKPESGWLTAWWPGLLWLLGAGLVAGRAVGARLLLVVFRIRHSAIQDTEFLGRFHDLARRMGIHRTIQVIEDPGLMSPFTFGSFRPIIALPATFVHDLHPVKQDVMLAHELSHVAGRDPAWLLIADFMTALLWWHPLSWRCRHQLHAACEETADEASLLLADGPAVLAACLVELGGQLVNHSQFGGASVAGNGFRSSLGRRVDRLLHLSSQPWSRPPRRRLLVLVIATVPILFMVVTLSAACMPWSGDRGTIGGHSKGDNPMTSWRQSIAGMALCVFLTPATDTAVAQDATKPASTGSQSSPRSSSEGKTLEKPSRRPPAPTPGLASSTQQEAPANASKVASEPVSTSAQSSGTLVDPADDPALSVAVSESGQAKQTAPEPQRIKIFRLSHRQPGEVLEILRGLAPVYEGGAQGVPLFYSAWVAEGSIGSPGNKGGSSPPGGMAGMMAKMGSASTGRGMASMMASMGGPGGPGVSSAGPASGSPCLFAIDGRTRSLIARGTEKALQVVADFVAILDLPDDKPIPKLKNVHAFKLRFAKPSVVNQVLKELNIDVLVAQIPKSNIILLNGPDPAIKEATEIIEALDAEVKEGADKDRFAPEEKKQIN
jgi:beta-lactamase regulating signal transducer with metallopeptidase domain